MRDNEVMYGKHVKRPSIQTAHMPQQQTQQQQQYSTRASQQQQYSTRASQQQQYSTRASQQQPQQAQRAVRNVQVAPQSTQTQQQVVRDTSRSFAIPQKKRKKGKIILAVVLVLLVAVGAYGFCLYQSAKTLKSSASSVMQDVTNIKTSIMSGDYDQASTYAGYIAKTSADMKQEMESPVWVVASVFPYVGNDVTSAKQLVDILNDASTTVLIPLTSTLSAAPLDSIVNESGGIDIDAVSTLLSAVKETAPAMNTCAQKISSVPSMNIPQLETMLGSAKTKVIELNETFQDAVQFIPAVELLLGNGSTRSYLITAQNSAEIRASGGFPGAVASLNINDGAISLGDFGTPYNSFATDTPESVAATSEELTLFSGEFLNISRDFGFNPDFKRTADVWASAYTQETQKSVDGVISITPSMIQSILKITGGITLSDGTELNGTNTTKTLQHDLYWKYCSKDVLSSENETLIDSLFAEAAKQTFTKLLGNLNAKTMVSFAKTMLAGTETREVMLYFTNSDEQAQIESLNISGALNFDETKPQVGTFVNIWIPSKLGWYLDVSTQIGARTNNADGTTTYSLTTTFTNTVDPAEIESAGTYIMGKYDTYDSGDMEPFLYLYAPCGGSISNLKSANTSTGSSVNFTEGSYGNLQVYYVPYVNEYRSETALLPGQSIVCTYDVTVSAAATSDLSVMQMPTLTQYRS